MFQEKTNNGSYYNSFNNNFNNIQNENNANNSTSTNNINNSKYIMSRMNWLIELKLIFEDLKTQNKLSNISIFEVIKQIQAK